MSDIQYLVHGVVCDRESLIDDVIWCRQRIGWRKKMWKDCPAVIDKNHQRRHIGDQPDKFGRPIDPIGYKHEYCHICNWEIKTSSDPKVGSGYVFDDLEVFWVCCECYEQFIHGNTLGLPSNASWIDSQVADFVLNCVANLVRRIDHLPSAHASGFLTISEAIREYGWFVEDLEDLKVILSPKEPGHQELIQLVTLVGDKIIGSINGDEINTSWFETASQHIYEKTENVLRRELDRIITNK